MIGHYVNTLGWLPNGGAAEDRLLTQQFEPLLLTHRGKMPLPKPGCRCLALMVTDGRSFWGPAHHTLNMSPGKRYEELAGRFGVERVNAAIRNRILSNRARRMLAGAPTGIPAFQEVSA